MMEKITHRGHFGNLEGDSKESLALLFARFTNPWIIIIIIILIIITIIIIIISSIICNYFNILLFHQIWWWLEFR